MTEATNAGAAGATGNDGAAAAAAAGAAANAGANAGGAAAGGDWISTLSPDLRPVVEAKGWKTPGDALTSYVNLERTVDLDKVPLPPKAADGTRDWTKADDLFKALGRPEEPGKYAFKMPAGAPATDTDKAFHGAMAPLLHKAGLAQWQVDILAEGFNGFGAQTAEQAQQRNVDATKAAETVLRQKFGGAYDAKIDGASRLARQYGGDGILAELDKAGFGRNPALVEMMANIYDAIAEDGALPGEKKGAAGALAPAEAKAQIAQMEGDKAQVAILEDKNHPEHQAMVEKRSRLYAMAYPEQAA